MKKLFKSGLCLILLLTSVGWVDVSATKTNSNLEEKIELVLSDQDIILKHKEVFDPLSVVVSGTYDKLLLPIVDTSVFGAQNIVYIAQKGHQQVKITKTIYVLDGIGPVITGEDKLELRYDSDFDILSAYEVSDNIDESIELELIGDLNRSEAGEYSMTLKAVDSSKNETTKEIVIIVNEDPEVIALNERNEAYSALVTEASNLNSTLLADTSVSEVESMLNRVNQASSNESDYQAELVSLSNELSAKLVRVQDFYKETPAAPTTPSTPTAPTTPSTPTTPVTPTEPVVVEQTPSTDGAFNVTMTRYGMDCYGCVVTNGVAYTSHGIALQANAVLQPNGTWQNGITYNGRYIIAGNRNHVKCSLITIYDHPYEGMGIVQGQPIYGIMADNGAFGYNHLDLFVGTETNVNAVWIANSAAKPYAIITGFATFTGSGCSF